MRICVIGIMLLGACCGRVLAGEVTVAVATNFLVTAQMLGDTFESASGHRVALVSGSTGQLYAQIANGAPYDIFLAADQQRPRLLAESGAGISDSVMTYATGRLVLWSRDPALLVDMQPAALGTLAFRWLALADPAVAPYGAAALQALERLGIRESLQSRIVYGQNVAQAFARVETANAEFGLVALAQVLAYDPDAAYVLLPAALYDPIRQDAVLLARATANPAAHEFMQYLASDAAGDLIVQSGYARH